MKVYTLVTLDQKGLGECLTIRGVYKSKADAKTAGLKLKDSSYAKVVDFRIVTKDLI